MILISHRGNTKTINHQKENSPEYINEALEKGFDVEIDVWFIDNKFFLGHDEPQYEISKRFLQNKKLWCHAKSIDTFCELLDDEKIHCFFHQEDDVTLTSEGYMWTYTGKDLTKKSIAVLPSKKPQVEIAGICSDYIERYK